MALHNVNGSFPITGLQMDDGNLVKLHDTKGSTNALFGYRECCLNNKFSEK